MAGIEGPRINARWGAPRALLAALMVGVPTSIPGCASSPTTATNDQSPSRGAVARLGSLAERESRSARLRAVPDAALPTGLIDADLSPIASDDEAARASLDAVATDWAAFDAPIPGEATSPTGAGLRDYIQAREAFLTGDLVRAEQAAVRAIEADPAAAEPRILLGEIMLSRRRAPEALNAFRAAIERDPTDASALTRAAWLAARMGVVSAEETRSLLARAWLADSSEVSTVQRALVTQDLAKLLMDDGSLTAARDALRFVVETGADEAGAARDWRTIGDLSLRLGEPEEALEAYAQSAALPSGDDGDSLLPRRVLADVRRGAPAAAAVRAIEYADAGPIAMARCIPLFEMIAEASSLDAVLGDALAETAGAWPTPEAPAWDEPRARTAIGLLARAAVSGRDATELLLDALDADPDDAAALRALHARVETDADAIRATRSLIERSPMRASEYVDALLLARPRPGELIDRLTGERPGAQDAAARLLGAILLGKTDPRAGAASIVALLERPERITPALRAAACAEAAALLADAGIRAEAEALLKPIGDDPSIDAAVAVARGRLALGKASSASQALTQALPDLDSPPDPATEPGATVWLLASEAAQRAGLPELALRHAQRLAQSARWRDDGLAREATLRLTEPALRDDARLTDIAYSLSEIDPAGAPLARLRAASMASSRQFDAAIDLLLPYADRDPTDEETTEALVSLWAAAERMPDAEAWLRLRLDERPYDRSLNSLLTRALAHEGRHTEAAGMLRAWLAVHPGDDAASRRLEAILRGPLEQPSEAEALALSRLLDSPETRERDLELAEVFIRQNRWEDAARALVDAASAGGAAGGDIHRRFSAALLLIANAAAEDRASPTATLDAIDACLRLGRMPAEVHSHRIGLLVRLGMGVDEIDSAAIDFEQQHREESEQAVLLAAQALEDLGRTRDALTVIASAGRRRSPITARLGLFWAILAVQSGDADEAISAARAADRDGLTAQVLTGLLRAEPGDVGRGDLAFQLASSFFAVGEDAAAHRLYREALRLQPDHVMANNNFGYSLLERDESPAEAIAMIERAFARDPDDLAIIDSIGWARYKQGVFNDGLGPDGEKTEGAITHLTRAVELARREDDRINLAIISDHLGDALWRAGEREGAIRAWTMVDAAVSLVLRQLDPQVPGVDENPTVIELRETQVRAKAKLDAAERGDEPETSPVLGPDIGAPPRPPPDGPPA